MLRCWNLLAFLVKNHQFIDEELDELLKVFCLALFRPRKQADDMDTIEAPVEGS